MLIHKLVTQNRLTFKGTTIKTLNNADTHTHIYIICSKNYKRKTGYQLGVRRG